MCLAALLLSACSSETEGPDRAGTGDRSNDADGGTAGRGRSAAGPPGYTEYTVEDVLLRREAAALEIEEARLQRTEESGSQEVVVRTAVRPPADYENCLLMREPTWRDLERSLAEDDLPDKQVFEHPWGRRTLREEFVVGDEMVVVFSESRDQDAGSTDAGDVKLYALCYTEVVTSGAGGRRLAWYDVSRVDGTPEPSPEP